MYPVSTTDGLAWFSRTSRTIPLPSCHRPMLSGPGSVRGSSFGRRTVGLGTVPTSRWEVGADDPLRRAQVTLGDAPHVLGRDLFQPPQVALEPRVIGKH